MVTERILAVIEYSDLSQTAFAKKIGSTQANLWRQLNGQKVNVGTLTAIVEQFPEINCNWLLRGEGEMQQEIIKNLQEKIKQLQNQ